MTTATSAPVTDTDKTLDASLATVAGEIARTDGKASLFSEPIIEPLPTSH
ncbi:hypothetical protein [Streptomyces mirabilis]